MSNNKPTRPFPIVGIGASAGGLAAFEEFFSGQPADGEPGMAFILVQHLAPDHDSILDQLVGRHTRMEVREIEDGDVVRINCAYVIPPGYDLTLDDGILHLQKPTRPRGQRLPIDSFFASLARSHGSQAIAIILSGSGQDGSEGIRAIKAAGGLVLVQDPSTAEFDSMPRSAIETGLVDYQLNPSEMPQQLLACAATGFGTTVQPEEPSQDSSLQSILEMLRAQTQHDFSQYKPSTILRRLDRRVLFHRLDSLESYAQFLQEQPEELDRLFQEMLIGVTSLFRDPEAFAALEEQLIPRIFARRATSSTIRCWSAGCSTGEEAYSLAILMRECIDGLKQNFRVQIFATDIDPQAIATARVGVYPKSIEMEISPERLARFFTPEPDGSGYRIHKSIRDMLVFSEQDLIKDPPFSKLDLILCRNVMIYMGSDLHKKLLALFHYALNPGGFLFLGNSETVGDSGDLFVPVDRKSKLYQRQVDLPGKQHPHNCQFLSPVTPKRRGRSATSSKFPGPVSKSLREITEHALLTLVTPPSALVNVQGDVLYLHGRAGKYLEPAEGEARTLNLFRMARESLRWELITAIRRSAELGEVVCRQGIRLEDTRDSNVIAVKVYPILVLRDESPVFLVVLDEQAPELSMQTGESPQDDSAEIVENRILALKRELQIKEDYLQVANLELEVSNDELKSANEEMQSMNEELQSSNEELETSKEELQSVNEELTTVNSELQTKVLFLSRAHSDLNNLLAGTGIATMFVDQDLRILRFTPATSAIINLIPSDVGRPMGHIVSNLQGEERLEADAQSVLETLEPHEAEIVTKSGTTYRMHVKPYRTLDNLVEGVVFTFVDISEGTRLASARPATREARHE